jgi:hypothetical protein
MNYNLFNSSQFVWGPMGPPAGLTELQFGEKTGIQSVITSPWVLRWQALPTTYNTYRTIRRHPTIALARAMSAAPILGAEWTIQSKDGVPDAWIRFIQAELLPLRQTFLEPALFYGNVDFGYQGYEKVFALGRDGLIHLRKLKPLLQDITEIIILPDGGFGGFKQPAAWLGTANALLIPFRVEGSLWYGAPLLENIRETYYQWCDANDGAARYDRKVAGGRLVVHYPLGQSPDGNGVLRDNSVLAEEILHTLQSSGAVAVPRDVAAFVQGLNDAAPGWEIEILDKGAGLQPTFVDRLGYLDKLLVRGLLLPERAVLEGRHGTLAEAETHGDTALTGAELIHRYVTQLVNWHCVDQLLTLNFGERARGAVWLEAAPVHEGKRAFLEKVYQAVLANPSGFVEEYGQIDTNAIKDAIGVPKAREVAQHDPDHPPPAALPGADPRSPLAASVRRVYAGLRTA